MQDNKYIPGVCNIGPEEIEKRQRHAFAFSFIALLFPYLSYYLGFPIIIKILVFLPAAAAIFSILQVYYKFCVYFGFVAVFNFGKLNETQTVASEADRQLDLKKAKKMVWMSLGLALLYTVIVVIFF